MQLLTTPLNNLSSQSLTFSRNGYISPEMLLEWFYIILESVAPVCLRCPERLNLVCFHVYMHHLILNSRNWAYISFLLSNDFLQFQEQHYSTLSEAQKQVSDMPSAQSLYKRAKDQLTSIIVSDNEIHLNQLTVQCKFLDSAKLESSFRTWNKLLAGFYPGQLSFLSRASSDTLPTEVNLRHWHIQCDSKRALCDSIRPTTAHVWVAAKLHYPNKGTPIGMIKYCSSWDPS